MNYRNIKDIYSWGPNPWMYPDLVGMFNKYKGALDIDFSIDVSVNGHHAGIDHISQPIEEEEN